MEAFFDGLDCRLRVSGMLADSIMMGIVNSAMEDAYKKSCTKEGILVQLNEKSRFCELAIMQLEWCLKFLQEETDNNSHIIESMHDRQTLLEELLVTRDRIHNRLEETELAIAEKDTELMERKERLTKLRLTLEERDDDISSLHSALRMERVKGKNKLTSCGVHESKNQLEEKIIRKLETEQGDTTNLVQKLNAFMVDMRKMVSGVNGDYAKEAQKIEEDHLNGQMVAWLKTDLDERAVDVDVLKDELASSFKLMESSVSLFKSMLDEQQWVLSFEQEIVSVILRGFVSEIQDRHNVKHEGNIRPMLLDKSCLNFMDDIATLRNELQEFVNQKDVQCKVEGFDPVSGRNASLGAKKRGDDDFSETSSKVEKSGNRKGLSNKNPWGHSVAEIIKSHETIIERKARETNWLKGELLGEKGSSILRNDKNNDYVNELISSIIGRLEAIMKEKEKLVATFDDYRRVHDRDTKFLENDLSAFRAIPKQSEQISCCQLTSSELRKEISQLKQESEELATTIMMLEETYGVLLKGLLARMHLESIDYDVEALITEDMNQLLFSDAVKELSDEKESYDIERLLMEEIYCYVFSEAIKDVTNTTNSNRISEKMDLIQKLNSLSSYYNVEALIRENTCRVVLSEMIKEWNMERDSYNTERLLSEDIHFTVFSEVVEDIKKLLDTTSTGCQAKQSSGITDTKEQILEEDSLSNYYDAESQIREHTHMVLFSEMAKEWCNEKEIYLIEKFLMEVIDCTIFTEVAKSIESAAKLASMRCLEEYLPVSSSLCQSNVISERMGSVQNVDSQSSNSDDSSESSETSSSLDLQGFEQEETNKQFIQDGRLWNMKNDAKLECGNNEKDLPQIDVSKIQVGGLESGLSFPPDDENGANERDSLSTKYREIHWDGFQAMVMPFTNFPQVIMDFEHRSCGKIRANMSRLENLNHQFNSVVEQANSIKKKELLYRKAFERRCYDLQTAEIEVDLLGDQVDRLLGLIEKIYKELNYHSAIFQNYSGITGILRSVQNELHKEVAVSSRQ